MKIEFIVALVGIVGVILGAGIQYVFTSRVENKKHFQQLRTSAYVDFLKSTAGTAISQKKQDPEGETAAIALMTDAKSRIAIYGSPEVAAAVADFFRHHGALTTPESFAAFVDIVAVMRADTPNVDATVSRSDIGQLVVGADVN